MKRVGIAGVLLAALFTQVHSQQRTINEGTPGQVLRSWPRAGAWAVALAVAKDRSLSCLMMTGEHDRSTGTTYFWGVRKNRGNTALIIIEKNRQAIAGKTIKVMVEGLSSGVYPISQRFDDDDAHTVWAELTPRTVSTMTNLFRVGGTLKFVTDIATYSAALKGAAQALGDLSACTLEADELNSAQQSQN